MDRTLAMTGRIIEICIAETGKLPVSCESVAVEAGKGLVGDRYYNGAGTFSGSAKKNRESEITFIAAEEIDRFNASRGTGLGYSEFRRNVVTRGVDLNALVGMEFEIAGVRFQGIELCEPCAHLAKVLHPEVLPHLVHRGGLRAAIQNSGSIAVDCAVITRPD